MKRRHWLQVMSVSLLSSTARADESFREGKDFKRIDPPLTLDRSKQVDVLELFWYRCPHCDHLQPLLDDWRKKRGDKVHWRRMPAVLSNTWALQARAFYTAEALGMIDRIHGPLFDAYHRSKLPLKDEADMAKFFAGFGVDEARFKSTFNSFGVSTKTQGAVETGHRLQLEGVPAIVVAGRYLVSPGDAGSPQKAIQVMEYLIAREQRSLNGASKT